MHLVPDDAALLLLHTAVPAVSPSGTGSEQVVWLPTSCLQLLQQICAARPNHLIIAADFDELPEVTVPGHGAPLVASTVHIASPQDSLLHLKIARVLWVSEKPQMAKLCAAL